MSEELKPCLLCNGVSVGFRDHGLPETQIGCNDCGLTTRYYPNRAEAIAAWNTRPAPKADGLVEELQDAFPDGATIGVRLSADMFSRILAALKDRDVVLEEIAGTLERQDGEPISGGESARLHYWRDKAIHAARAIRNLKERV